MKPQAETAEVTYVSVWDGGHEHRTDARVDLDTGVVTAESSDPGEGVQRLDREYVETADGREFGVMVGDDGIYHVLDLEALRAASSVPRP